METTQVTTTMPDNDTLRIVYSSPVSPETEELLTLIEQIFFHISCVLTTATLIYGVTSWSILKKFRHYRNYVFLNLILQNFFTFIFYYGITIIRRYIPLLMIAWIFLCLAAARVFWMLVVCHMFYVDIVKVFDGDIRRKYLKSALFGWGLPLLYSGIQVGIHLVTSSYSEIVLYCVSSIPLILNTILYIFIVCKLFRSSNASANTASNKCRLFFIASLIFILSDGFIFSQYLLMSITNNRWVKFITSFPNRLTTSVILNVYLIIVKRNREVWYEFYVKKRNERKRNRDIQMNVKNVRETAVSPPAVINVEK